MIHKITPSCISLIILRSVCLPKLYDLKKNRVDIVKKIT
ncbi:UNVERIFIED_ORG: hypothetical protein QQG_6294 [Clostridioides difficile Y384]